MEQSKLIESLAAEVQDEKQPSVAEHLAELSLEEANARHNEARRIWWEHNPMGDIHAAHEYE